MVEEGDKRGVGRGHRNTTEPIRSWEQKERLIELEPPSIVNDQSTVRQFLKVLQ